MAMMKKKLISLAMVCALVINMLPISAFASAEDPKQVQQAAQIDGFQGEGSSALYYTWDKTLGSFTNGTADPMVYNDGSKDDHKVSVSKTIAPTGTENLFDITLDVRTRVQVKQVSQMPDAAVVLVLDLSDSMLECVKCSGKGNHATGCELSGSVTSAQSKLAALQQATVQFGQAFAKSGEYQDANGNRQTAKRYIALSVFSSAGSLMSYADGTNQTYWLDVAALDWSEKTENLFTKSMGQLGGYIRPGTNVAHGLAIASDLLKTLFTDEPPVDIGNLTRETSYVLLLGDGEPTVSGTSPGGYDRINAPGTFFPDHLYENAERWVNKIRMDGTKVMTAYAGTDPQNQGYRWFKTLYSGCVLASSATDLVDSFMTTILMIKLSTKAWVVTDTLGNEMDYVASDAPGDNVQVANDVLTWTLRNDVPKVYQYNESTKAYDKPVDKMPSDEELKAGKYEFCYSMSYQAQLDTNKVDGTTYYPVGTGSTALRYYLTDGNGNFIDDAGKVIEGISGDMTEEVMIAKGILRNLTFKSPKVKGYQGTLAFRKVADYDTNKGLEGAKFGLYLDETLNDLRFNGDSDREGKVFFGAIPSGRSYTLAESNAAAGYLGTPDTATITVSYGKTSASNDGDGKLLSGGGELPLLVKNELDPVLRTVTVNKAWVNDDVGDDSVTVDVVIEGTDTVVDTLTVSRAGDWTATSKDLPTVDVKTGLPIVYTVKERIPQGASYKQVLLEGGKQNDGNFSFQLTNLVNGSKTITLEKFWVAPASMQQDVIVDLYRDGVLYESGISLTKNAQGRYTATRVVPTLQEGISGESSVYYVREISVGGRPVDQNTSSVTIGDNVLRASYEGTTVTNTIEQRRTSVTGTKTWNVNGFTGVLQATFTLYADGQPTSQTAELKSSDTVQEYHFNDLPKYALGAQGLYEGMVLDGHEIVYSVVETEVVPVDGTLEAGDTIRPEAIGNNYTNTLTGTVEITVEKVWNDDGAYQNRPDTVVLELWASNDTKAPVKTATFAPEQDENGILSWDAAELSKTFSLPKYDNGTKILYSVREGGLNAQGVLPGKSGTVYAPTYDGFTVTNTLEGGEVTLTIQKKWVDLGGQHAAVDFAVMQGDVTVAEVTLSEDSGWNTTVTLPRYENGKAIEYTVTELTQLEGYEPVTVRQDGNEWTFINQLSQQTTAVSGTKTWVGGIETARPEAIFTLYQTVDGVTTSTGKSVSSTALTAVDGVYAFSFQDLPKYEIVDGESCKVIAYSIVETMTGAQKLVDRYTGTHQVDADGVYHFTNTFDPGTAHIQGTKFWKAGPFTAEVQVGVFSGGELVSQQTTQALKYSFQLPKCDVNGDEIVYTVRELSDGVAVDQGGKITIDGVDYDVSYDGNVQITNALPQSNEGALSFTKLWRGPAGESATFVLTRATEQGADTAFRQTLTLNAADFQGSTWKGTFTGLALRDAGGYLYTYDVNEVLDAGSNDTVTIGDKVYTAEKQEIGNVFINTIVDPKNGSFQVTKSWAGEGAAPTAVQIQLFADDVALGEPITLSTENEWHHTFTGLALYNADTYQPIDYTVREVGVDVSGKIQIGNVHYLVTVTAEGNTATITNTAQSVETYSYIIYRNYDRTVDGVAQPRQFQNDESWTHGTQSQTVQILGSSWTTFGDVTYDFAKAEVNGMIVTDPDFQFTLDKLSDGANSYVVNLYYTSSYTTPDTDPDPDPDPDPGPGPDVDVPDEDVPQGGGNGGTEEPAPGQPETDIGDVDVPLADLPDVEPPLTDLGDMEIPLDAAPKTGDLNGLRLWISLMGLSGMGLAALGMMTKGRGKKQAN